MFPELTLRSLEHRAVQRAEVRSGLADLRVRGHQAVAGGVHLVHGGCVDQLMHEGFFIQAGQVRQTPGGAHVGMAPEEHLNAIPGGLVRGENRALSSFNYRVHRRIAKLLALFDDLEVHLAEVHSLEKPLSPVDGAR